MDLSFVLHETHTRGISAVGFNAARRELLIGYEGTLGVVHVYLQLINILRSWRVDLNCFTLQRSMGGDYRGNRGMCPPTPQKKILLGGCKHKHPPQQLLLLVKKIRLFSILTTILVYTVYSPPEVLKCSCLYKLVNDVPVNLSDVAFWLFTTAPSCVAKFCLLT